MDKRVSAALLAIFTWYISSHPIETRGTEGAIEAPEPAQSGNPMKSPPEPNPVGYTRISGTSTQSMTMTTAGATAGRSDA